MSESYSFISPPFSHTDKLFSKPMHLDNMSLLCLLNKKKSITPMMMARGERQGIFALDSSTLRGIKKVQ